MARRLKCRTCGRRWGSRLGTVIKFYETHAAAHGLPPEPRRAEGEGTRAFMDRLLDWRDKDFEDSDMPAWRAYNRGQLILTRRAGHTPHST